MRPRPRAVEAAEPTASPSLGGSLSPQLLASEEARHRALFAALRTPIITTGSDSRVTGFNAAAVALLGSPARLYGRPIQEVLPFVSAPAGENGIESTWQGRIPDATGRSVDLEVTLTRLDDGERATAVYVVHDISRHAEVNRLREQLLYNVAHELRGPLMVLDNALEILGSDYAALSAEEFDRLVASARRTTRRLRTLMEDLLSAGSIQSGHFVVAPRVTPIETIVRDALEIVAPLTEAREQQVHVELPDQPIQVMADQRYARQVLSNLLANASKYTPDRAEIRVRVEDTGKLVRVTVEDRGPGIPAEQRAGLFERFYRISAGTEEPGIGLGLAIAKGIVDAHGGSIGVDSEVGVGTRVWFTLPSMAKSAA